MGVPGLGLTMLGRNKCPVLVACSHGEAHPAGRPQSRWESGAAWLAGCRAGTSGSGANTWKCVPRLPGAPRKHSQAGSQIPPGRSALKRVSELPENSLLRFLCL